MRVPTVRVKHPALGFVTINASDLTEQHELHHEQAEGFDPADLRQAAPSERLDPALRDAAAALCLRLVGFRRATERLPFDGLTPAEQLALITDMGAELDASMAAYETDQRERAAYEAEEAERRARIDSGTERTQDALDEADPPAAPVPLRVEKGARGHFYVMQGQERVSRGFRDEADAEAERARLSEAL